MRVRFLDGLRHGTKAYRRGALATGLVTAVAIGVGVLHYGVTPGAVPAAGGSSPSTSAAAPSPGSTGSAPAGTASTGAASAGTAPAAISPNPSANAPAAPGASAAPATAAADSSAGAKSNAGANASNGVSQPPGSNEANTNANAPPVPGTAGAPGAVGGAAGAGGAPGAASGTGTAAAGAGGTSTAAVGAGGTDAAAAGAGGTGTVATGAGGSPPNAPGAAAGTATESLVLSDAQLGLIAVGRVSERVFPIEREAVGNIDFNEDMTVQVFPPYQGRISKLYVKVGDGVARGQILFTIESPDLIQAESNLIAAAGVLDLTAHALERARQLFTVEGMAEKDLQQAVSDQQSAEGSLKAARDAVAVFGKSSGEIDRMVRTRTIDPSLVVRSPIAGTITTRNAALGDFVQPGTMPCPYSVADLSRMWVNAAVTESDMPMVRKGQRVRVTLMALPRRVFEGEITTVGAAIDPQLHRGLIRAEIDDPHHELLPGMFASFAIVTGDPVNAAAMPVDGVVREGDGSMTVWITADRHHFIKRTVKVGLVYQGYDQILDGVRAGDGVVTKGAVFLDNLAAGSDS